MTQNSGQISLIHFSCHWTTNSFKMMSIFKSTISNSTRSLLLQMHSLGEYLLRDKRTGDKLKLIFNNILYRYNQHCVFVLSQLNWMTSFVVTFTWSHQTKKWVSSLFIWKANCSREKSTNVANSSGYSFAERYKTERSSTSRPSRRETATENPSGQWQKRDTSWSIFTRIIETSVFARHWRSAQTKLRGHSRDNV